MIYKLLLTKKAEEHLKEWKNRGKRKLYLKLFHCLKNFNFILLWVQDKWNSLKETYQVIGVDA